MYTPTRTFTRYAVLLATLAVMLLASCPVAVHTRVLFGRDDDGGPSLSKRTLPHFDSLQNVNVRGADVDGQLLSNAARLALGFPLKKPQLPRSGEQARISHVLLSLTQAGLGGRLRARQSATPTSQSTSSTSSSSSSSSSAPPTTPTASTVTGTIQVFGSGSQLLGWVGVAQHNIFGIVSNGKSDPALVVSMATDPSIVYHELAIQVRHPNRGPLPLYPSLSPFPLQEGFNQTHAVPYVYRTRKTRHTPCSELCTLLRHPNPAAPLDCCRARRSTTRT